MCAIKTVLVSVCLTLLIAASFCMYSVHSEKKVAHRGKIEGQVPCENEYKKYCLNCGDCYYLIDENVVGCYCTSLYGGKRCDKYMWWTWVRL